MERAKKTDTSEIGDDDLITLQEAAALIPGADARTLKRRVRQGLLTSLSFRQSVSHDARRREEDGGTVPRRPKVRDSGSAQPAPTPPAG
jgi:hypothetical protein